MEGSSHSGSDIEVLWQTAVHHFAQLIDDVSIMQLLPLAVRLQLKNTSPDGRVQAVEKLLILRTQNPAIREALANFVDRCSMTVAPADEARGLSSIDWSLPAVNPQFIGRHEELKQIHASLLAAAPRSVVINGFDGMGKSALARKAIARADVEARFNIVWVPCRDIRDIPQLRRKVGGRLSMTGGGRAQLLPFDAPISQASADACSSGSTGMVRPMCPGGRSAYSPLAIFDRFRGKRRRKRLLIVLDGLDYLLQASRGSLALEETLLQLQSNAVLVVTSMAAVPFGAPHFRLDVDCLSNSHANALFRRCAPLRTLDDPAWDSGEVEDLVARFRGYPLAIKLAAQQITAVGGVRLLKHQLAQHTDKDAMDRLLHVAVDNAARNRPKIRSLVRLLAYWPKWSCPLALICACLDMHCPDDAVLLASPLVDQGLLAYAGTKGDPSMLDVFRINDPYQQRISLLFQPRSRHERDAMQHFCFRAVFENAALSRGSDGFEFFEGLDPIFVDALQDVRVDNVNSALAAMLRLPRKLSPSLYAHQFLEEEHSIPFDSPVQLFEYPLSLDSLKEALQQANRLQAAELAALLKLIYWEAALQEGMSTDEADVQSCSVDLDTVLRLFGSEGTTRGKRAVRNSSLLLALVALDDIASCEPSQVLAFRKQARQYLQSALVHTMPLTADDEALAPHEALEAPFDLLQMIPLQLSLFDSADDFASTEGSIFQMLQNSAKICRVRDIENYDCLKTYHGCVLLAAKACVHGAIDFAARFVAAVAASRAEAYAWHGWDPAEVLRTEPWSDPPFWSLDRWGPMLRAYLPRDEPINRLRERLARKAAWTALDRRAHAYSAWLSMTVSYGFLLDGRHVDVGPMWFDEGRFYDLEDTAVSQAGRPLTVFLVDVRKHLREWHQSYLDHFGILDRTSGHT